LTISYQPIAVLPIFLYGTKVLREVAKPVKELDDSIVKLAVDMFETMHKANGIGLAANQVGVLKRVIIVDIADVDESPDETEEDEEPEENPRPRTSPDLPRTLTLINPEIITSENEWEVEEGCLSIPQLHGEVVRPETIVVRYRDANFKERELRANGLLARVIQHEMDHLDGVLFIDHMGKTRRSLLSNSLRRIKKGDVETSYPAVTAEEE
jgi:peptide deformylase